MIITITTLILILFIFLVLILLSGFIVGTFAFILGLEKNYLKAIKKGYEFIGW